MPAVDKLLDLATLAGVDSANLLAVAQRYTEFAPIVKVLVGECDKQHVPSARLIWRDRLFHAALWHHGFKREAVALQCLNGAFEAFDGNHLTWTYRCYLRERARRVCYALLGPEHRDVRKLCKLGGQDCSNGRQALRTLWIVDC